VTEYVVASERRDDMDADSVQGGLRLVTGGVRFCAGGVRVEPVETSGLGGASEEQAVSPIGGGDDIFGDEEPFELAVECLNGAFRRGVSRVGWMLWEARMKITRLYFG
jgi:hypothetical protein